MKYLLDSNTLIEAKNRYYSMKICPGYWKFLDKKHNESLVASISIVKDELERGKDELAEWAKENKQIFLNVDDEATQNAYAKIVSHVAGLTANMKPGALEDFLTGADPWLIAKAMATDSVVVTHEAYNPATKRKFLIPNICKDFGVTYMDTFMLLDQLNAEFVLPT